MNIDTMLYVETRNQLFGKTAMWYKENFMTSAAILRELKGIELTIRKLKDNPRTHIRDGEDLAEFLRMFSNELSEEEEKHISVFDTLMGLPLPKEEKPSRESLQAFFYTLLEEWKTGTYVEAEVREYAFNTWVHYTYQNLGDHSPTHRSLTDEQIYAVWQLGFDENELVQFHNCLSHAYYTF